MPRVPAASSAAVVLVALTVFHTWPLCRAPARLSLNYNADAQLNEWIVSWVAHALVKEPGRLFAGNIFQPDDHALAYSEPLIVPALAGAPLRWLGGSPVLTFNLLLCTGLAATALATWWVVFRWTGSFGAGLIGGALAAFNTHLLTRLPHLQAAHAWGLPLAIYFTDRLAGPRRGERPTWPSGSTAAGSWRIVLLLALVIVATALTSEYWLFFAGLVIVAGAVAGVDSLRAAGRIMVACAVGAAMAIPALLPYIRLGAGGTRRPVEIVAQFSAALSGYLVSTSRVDFWWGRRFYTNGLNLFFPGMVAVALAVVGVADGIRDGTAARRRVAMLAIVVSAGILLSLGPAFPIYSVLYSALVPLQGLRAAVRFGYLFLLAVALAAGLGVAAVERRLSSRAAARSVALLLIAVTVEAWQGPVQTAVFEGIPRIYSVLDQIKTPVLLVEVPFYPPQAAFENAEYVLNATSHWRPIMNGYSGYTPEQYRRRATPFWFFPDDVAIAAMRREGATHIMVHLQRFGGEAAGVKRSLGARSDVELLADDDAGHMLYAFRQPASPFKRGP